MKPCRNQPPQSARMDVVSLLSDGGAMSREAEIVYMTGVSRRRVARYDEKGILRANTRKCCAHRTFSEVPRAAAWCFRRRSSRRMTAWRRSWTKTRRAPRCCSGVTGSGKTQVYLQLIAHALEQGKSAIVLVPEKWTDTAASAAVCARFGEEVAVLHSARCPPVSGNDSFKKIKTGRARVVIGTRSAVFAPAKNLGVIIIDEGAGRAYRSAVARATMRGMWQKYRAAQTDALLAPQPAGRDVLRRKKEIPVFTLTERFLGAGLPGVIISDMRGLAREGLSGIIGPDLERELRSARSKRGNRPSCSSTGAGTAA